MFVLALSELCAPLCPAYAPTIAHAAIVAIRSPHKESPKESSSSRLQNKRLTGPSCRRESAPDKHSSPPRHRNVQRAGPPAGLGSRTAFHLPLGARRTQPLSNKLRRKRSGNRALPPGVLVMSSCLSPETPTRSSVYGIRALGVPLQSTPEHCRRSSRTGESTRARAPAPHKLGSRPGDFRNSRLARALGLLRREMILGQSIF